MVLVVRAVGGIAVTDVESTVVENDSVTPHVHRRPDNERQDSRRAQQQQQQQRQGRAEGEQAARHGSRGGRDLPAAGISLPGANDTGTVSTRHGVVTLRNATDPAWVASKVKGAIGVGSAAYMGEFTEQFMQAIGQHRLWSRSMKDMVPA